MRTLRTILATLFFVALAANSNAQWTTATYGAKLDVPTKNVGIGIDPNSKAKLRLYNNVSTSSSDTIFGLHSLNTFHSATGGGGTICGVYLKNAKSGGNAGTSYGIYSHNEGSNASSSLYGAYFNNIKTGSGGSSVYGVYSANSDAGVGATYGAYFNNIKTGNSGDVYGVYSANSSAGSVGSIYGSYLSASQISPSSYKYVYGLYSTVTGGTDDKRWAGYFTGGNVAIMDGNVSIGATTANNDQSWQRVLDVYSLESSKLLVRTNTLKTGIFSHNTWNGMVGRIGTESNHDLRLMAGYGNDVITLKTDGNVGIGKTDPQAKLHVDGSVFLPFDQSYWIGNNADSGNRLRLHHNNTAAYIDYAPTLYFRAGTSTRVTFDSNGNVGIGVLDPQYKLDVKGAIRACDLWVNVANGCDYVFADNYNLMSLSDLGNFAKTNRHLPDIAPAVQMESEGINVSEMSTLLLKKVEELTLYVIELEKKNNVLESRLDALTK